MSGVSYKAWIESLIKSSNKIEETSIQTDYLKSRGINFETYAKLETIRVPKSSVQVGTHEILVIVGKSNIGENAVQRIIISNSDEGFKNVKRNHGPIKSKCVKLFSENEDVSKIVIVEGVFTGLAVRQATKLPVFCALTANNMTNLVLPDEVKEAYIFSDFDLSGTGQRYAHKLNTKLRRKNILAFIIEPPQLKPNCNIDWNDVLKEKGESDLNLYFEQKLAEQRILLETKCDEDPYSIAHRITEYFIEAGETKWQLLYQNKKWYQRTNANIFKLKTDKEIEIAIVKLMQNNKWVTGKIKNDFDKNVCLNLKGLLSFEELEFPQILNMDLDYRDVLFTGNSVLNIKDKNIETIDIPNETDIFTKYRLPVEFSANSDCPKWKIFLNEISAGDIQFQKLLQEFFGFCLTSHYDFHKFLYVYGKGRNGKGVISTVLKALLSPDAVSSLVIEDLSTDVRFRTSILNDKLANITNEGNFRKSVNVNALKDLVSGGTITVEIKHQDAFSMINTAKFVILSNELLKLDDNSDAAWSRALVLPINFQILDTTLQNPELSDIKFWQSDKNEMSGILKWAIEGRQRLYANKRFTEVDFAKDFVRECQKSSNHTRTFLQDYFEHCPGSKISTDKMFQQYKAYCSYGNFHIMNLSQFSHEVALCFPLALKSKEAISIDGQRLRGWHNIKEREDKNNTHNTPITPLKVLKQGFDNA